MQGWASVALPAEEVPAPGSARVSRMSGCSCLQDHAKCICHNVSPCSETLRLVMTRRGLCQTLTHPSAKCLWARTRFFLVRFAFKPASQEQKQVLNLSFTKSSIYQWHLICLSPSFCWAVKLQNEPLQQKAHLIQTASVRLWVEKYVKSHSYFNVFSFLYKFKIFLNSPCNSFSDLVLIPQLGNN